MLFTADTRIDLIRMGRWFVASVALGVTVLITTNLAPAAISQREHLHEAAKKVEARNAYQAFCADCHGRTGEGQSAEGERLIEIDFTVPAAAAGLDRDAIISAMQSGHDEVTRKRWTEELDLSDIAGIAGYIREAFILPTPASDSSVGQRIYARTCSVCHGERGDGVSLARNSLWPPPRDFTGIDPEQLSRRDMINTATYGNDGTAMQGFATQFAPEEIAAVVDYIRDKFMLVDGSGSTDSVARSGDASHDAPKAAAGRHGGHNHGGMEGDMTAPFPNLLKGDATRGKKFYDQNCTDCHGRKGAGDGPRSYFINPRPRDFTSGKARVELNRPHLFSAIANGVKRKEMPAWSKVIDDQQIADVAEYVFRAFIQPENSVLSDRHDGAHTHDHPTHSHSKDQTVSPDPLHEHGHDPDDELKKKY